jgi:hypothetical protein
MRGAVRSIEQAKLVFPVGETLKVWLAGVREEAAFREALARVAPGLALRALRPSLHDVALRDLALSGSADDGASGLQRH